MKSRVKVESSQVRLYTVEGQIFRALVFRRRLRDGSQNCGGCQGF